MNKGNDEVNHEVNHEVNDEVNHEVNDEVNHEVSHEVNDEVNHEVSHEVNDEVKQSLLSSLQRLSQLQRVKIDNVELHQIIEDEVVVDKDGVVADISNFLILKNICHSLLIHKPKQIRSVNSPELLPLLLFDKIQNQWGILKAFNSKGEWVSEWFSADEQATWLESTIEDFVEYEIFAIKTKKKFNTSGSQIFQMVKAELINHKKWLTDAAIAGVLINVIAVVGAFYSLQVYDKVVPTGAKQTLLVLTIGALSVLLLEFVAKLVRAGLYEKLVESIDKRLSRDVYKRFLSIRMDQLPKSVGSLASQMRGYESIRSFLSSITTYLVVDVPFVMFYALLIMLLGGYLALIPLVFFIIAAFLGLYFHSRIEALADNISESADLKVGLLVETIEGAETIKSGQGGWRMLSNWMGVTDEGRDFELEMKRLREQSQFVVALFQQSSFIVMVSSGALLIVGGGLTMGGLMACSILSGRILAPVSQIPSHLAQWANIKSSVRSLDVIWNLKSDHDDIERPIIPENLRGEYRIDEKVQINYADKTGLMISKLIIKPGEKIAVLGPIGSGKTTFLRLLSGMYKPQEGRVFLDDIDLAHISKPILAEKIGFLQQDGRLFKGTIRENLILGLVDPGDDKILDAAKETGLLDSVISTHENGLEQVVYEGGTGLSGGQKQMVNLTRVVLRSPKVWLLDEPTASIDRNLEGRLINMFQEKLKPQDTLVLVTHKMQMIELIDRIIVIHNNEIIMDGPKVEIMNQLSGKDKQ